MAGVRIDWPPIDGLLPFVQKYGLKEAAERLGVSRSSLRSHLNNEGFTAKDYQPPKALNDDALQEIRDLIA